MTVIEDMVRQNGPMKISDSPLGSWGLKEEASHRIEESHTELNLFWPKKSHSGVNAYRGSFRPGTTTHKKIIYHDSEDKESVIRKYLSENPSLLENSSLWGIHVVVSRCYPEFKDASRRVMKEDYPERWTEEIPNG